MPETTSLGRVTQIAPEATPGTAVPATKQLTDLTFTVDPAFNVTSVRGAGHRADAQVNPDGQERVTGKLGGQVSFNSFLWPLGMSYGVPSPTTPGAATGLPGATGSGAAINARKWAFAPTLTGAQPGKSMTLEQGDSLDAEQVALCVMTDLGMDITRASCTPNGNMLGRAITKAAAGGSFTGMTGGTTTIPIVPVLPAEWSCFMDDTSANIGATQLTRCFHLAFTHSNIFTPFYPINASVYSFAGISDNPAQTQTCLLELMKDSVGEGLWKQARAGQRKYIRFVATSVLTAGGVTSGYYADNYTILSFTGGPTGGTFALSYKGVTSSAITYSGTLAAATVQSALTGISTVGTGNATVSGSNGGPFTIAMAGSLANDNTAWVVANNSLSGGTTPAPALAQTLIPYSMQIDLCASVRLPGPQADNSALRTRQWDFTLVEDPSWNAGQFLSITIINAMTAVN